MNFLIWFLSAQILLTLAAIFSLLWQRSASYSSQLRNHYAVAGAVLLILSVQAWIPVRANFSPIQKSMVSSISKSPKIKAWAQTAIQKPVPQPARATESAESDWKGLNFWLWSFFIFFVSAKILRDLRLLTRFRTQGFRIRKIGRVEILAHDQIQIALSFWTPRQAVVMVPSSLLTRPADCRITIAHELQHHRQRDPQWLFALQLIQWIGFANPLARYWRMRILEVQEFACDETLVDRSRVNSKHYARCLLEAAESTLLPRFEPAGATGFLFRRERSQLKRRIKMLLAMKPDPKRPRSKGGVQIAFVMLTLAGTAYAIKGLAQQNAQHVYTSAEVQKLASTVRGNDGLPIIVNAMVVDELNRYLSLSHRELIRDGLRNKPKYQSQIDRMLMQYQLPAVIDSVPLVESQYRELPESNRTGYGAGLWMFIASTARNYGLQVDQKTPHEVDERMNVEKITDAAGRLIKANADGFGDLGLSLLAYAWGERKVKELISRTGSRDPWVLQKAYPSEPYLARVMAAAIVIANPRIAD